MIGIIEDDFVLSNQLANLLEKEGYQTYIFEDFYNVLETLKDLDINLLLLDIHLPADDGYTLCKKIKQQYNLPIIFVTSCTKEEDELRSILSGGDDYITKPYHKMLLLEKIHRSLEKSNPQNHKQLIHHQVILDLHFNKITYQNKENELTRNEFLILYYLFLHPNCIVTKEELMEYLWNDKFYIDENILLVNIARLRKKIEEIGAYEFITTIRGKGYRI